LTLPNQGAPFGSVPFGGLSQFAASSLDDWLLSLLGEVVDRALQLLNPAAAIQQFANEAGVPQLAELLRSALESLLFGSALDLVNQIVAAITGLAGGTLQDLANWAANIASTLEDIPVVGPIISDIVEAITGILGGDLSFLTDWFNDLMAILGNPLGLGSGSVTLASLANIPLLGPIFALVQQIIDAITGLLGGDIPDLSNTFNNLTSIFGIPDLSTLTTAIEDFDLFGTINDFVGDILAPLGGVLNLFAPPSSLPVVTTGAITSSGDVLSNYLVNATFNTANSVSTGQGWSWENTLGHNGMGVAKVTADGQFHAMVSNEVHVIAGEGLRFTAWVKWANINYGTATNPIALGVAKYLNGIEVGSEDLATLATPAATGDWTELTANYTVPAQVDEIRLRLRVARTVVSGVIYFDDATVAKTDLISDAVVPGVGQTVDTVVQSLYGWAGDGFTHSDAYNALLNLASSVTANSAAIASILGQQTTGVYAVDDFKRVTSVGTLGGDWQIAQTWGGGTNRWYVNGEEAVWSKSGQITSGVTWKWIGTNTVSSTDTQKITAVLSAAPEYLYYHTDEYWTWSGIPPYVLWNPLAIRTYHPAVTEAAGGQIRLNGRMDTAHANKISALFWADGTVQIERTLGGVDAILAQADVGSAPGAGSSISLICGTGAGARNFEALINNQTVLTASDTTSNYGASYRGWGFAGVAVGHDILNTQASPGGVNSWFGQDN